MLLPIALVGSLLLVWQGVPQNFGSYTAVKTLEGAAQSIPQGPMASMEIIKELGTNGGGFVNANSAAPWENPTGFTDLIELVAIFLIGAALTYTFGRYVKNQRQGWALFAAMTTLFVVGFSAAYTAEAAGNPIVHALGVAGGNLEGKETRFGIAASALFATMTTDTSCGAVNAMHDSFTALGGLIPMFNMQLGEVVFGGVGSGFYGIIYYAILTVFIAGLMVGRTPEYLGKKIERREVQLAILAALVVPVFALVPAGIASILPAGTATLNNAGPHGFSEILYAYSSMVNNNGSAFAGLSPQHVVERLRRRGHVVRPHRDHDPGDRARGCPRRQAGGRGDRRHVRHDLVDLRRVADRSDPHRRSAHVLPGRRAGADRRASAHSAREAILMVSRSRSLFDRAILVPAIRESFVKLDPRIQLRNPVMFVVEVGALVSIFYAFRDVAQRAGIVRHCDLGMAVVHRAVRQLRGSDGGRAR